MLAAGCVTPGRLLHLSGPVSFLIFKIEIQYYLPQEAVCCEVIKVYSSVLYIAVSCTWAIS